MDKKDLYGIIDAIVNQVKDENSLSESVARAFVGTALEQNRDAFIAAVSIPRLEIAR